MKHILVANGHTLLALLKFYDQLTLEHVIELGLDDDERMALDLLHVQVDRAAQVEIAARNEMKKAS